MAGRTLNRGCAVACAAAFFAAALFALAAGAAPLKVAVFVGSGARNVGAFRWLELATMAEGVETAKLLQTLMRKGSSRIVPLAKRELDAGERAGYVGVLRCGGKAVEPLPPRP